MITEAIVLAGGLGTRLKAVISDIPKPMAPVGERPFLYFILKNLQKQGFKRVILSVGYRYEIIETYFGNCFESLELVYAIEKEPLGTGGGIANAMHFAREQEVALINGDTFFDVSLESLYPFHKLHHADISFSLKPMQEFDRYGRVEMDDKCRIKTFHEKAYCANGLINGGVYILNKAVFGAFSLPLKYSFEKDLLEKYTGELNLFGFVSDSYFIDIGIPEDYARAQKEMPLWL